MITHHHILSVLLGFVGVSFFYFLFISLSFCVLSHHVKCSVLHFSFCPLFSCIRLCCLPALFFHAPPTAYTYSSSSFNFPTLVICYLCVCSGECVREKREDLDSCYNTKKRKTLPWSFRRTHSISGSIWFSLDSDSNWHSAAKDHKSSSRRKSSLDYLKSSSSSIFFEIQFFLRKKKSTFIMAVRIVCDWSTWFLCDKVLRLNIEIENYQNKQSNSISVKWLNYLLISITSNICARSFWI